MCAPCKPIIDCAGALAGSLLLLAEETPNKKIASRARYYAHIVEWTVRTMIFAHENPTITTFEYEGSHAKAVDRAHAWSELSCHRAKLFRETALGLPISDTNAPEVTPTLLYEWAEEHRIFITEMVGGEYDSSVQGHEWVVNGVEGITAKE